MNQGHPIQSHALMGEMESVNCEFCRDEAKNKVHKLSHPPTQENNQLLYSAIKCDSARAAWRSLWVGGITIKQCPIQISIYRHRYKYLCVWGSQQGNWKL